jgi:hypothetical protein
MMALSIYALFVAVFLAVTVLVAVFFTVAAAATRTASRSARIADLVSVAGIATEVSKDRIAANSATPATSTQFTLITDTSWLVLSSARAACANVLIARSAAEAQKAVLVSIYVVPFV